MPKDSIEWLKFTVEKWHSPIGLLVGCIGAFFLFFSAAGIIFVNSPFSLISDNFWCFKIACGLLGFLITLSIWLVSRKCPKSSKEKIGILVAIRDDTEGAKKIKTEVVQRLSETISQTSIGSLVEVVPLDNFFSVKIVDEKSAVNFSDKTRCQFVIYGKLLNFDAEYEFDLKYIVRHIPLKNNSLVVKGFAEALVNKNWKLAQGAIIDGIKATENNIREIAFHVIGIAAHQSFDFKSSKSLHSELYQLLKLDNSKRKELNPIYESLPRWLSDTNTALSLESYYIEKDIEKALSFAEEALVFDASSYPAKLNKSLYLFELGDIDGAKKIIISLRKKNSRRGINDVGWRYSYAFLFFLDENYPRGLKEYKTAFYGVINEFTYFSLVEHITNFLNKNPNKIQFYFVLSQIFVKNGYHTRALDPLEKFISLSKNDPKFLPLIYPAKILLEKTYEELKIPLNERIS